MNPKSLNPNPLDAYRVSSVGWLALLSLTSSIALTPKAVAMLVPAALFEPPLLAIGRLKGASESSISPRVQWLAMTSDLPIQWSGELTEASQRLEDGRYYNTHRFEGVAGEAIAIEIMSKALHEQLILQGPSGVTLR